MLRLKDPEPGSREFSYVRAAIENDALVILPTDTVYGIAALALSEGACRTLYEAKGRDLNQATAVIFDSVEQVVETIPELSGRALAAADLLLPGPYTLLVANPGRHMPWLCGRDPGVLGVRVPAGAYPLPPVAATSANLPGEPEIVTVGQLPPEIAEHVACAVDVGPIEEGYASTILDLTAWERGDGEVKVLRDPVDRGPDALRQLATLG